MKSIKCALGFVVVLPLICLSACSSDDDPVTAPIPFVSTILDTQAKIDAFGAEGQTAYADRLVIGVENEPNRSIVDLTPLSDLTFVGGLTIFYNELLGDLTGLHNLIAIGGEGLLISDNPKLRGTGSLGRVSAFGDDIIIRRNDLLEDLKGLSKLKTVGGDLVIEGNFSLLDIEGLGSLGRVKGDFIIRGNRKLETLTGLDELFEILGNFSIEDNDNLNDILELGSLRYIHGDFFIRDNFHLDSIGWSSLEVISGDLNIHHNIGLESINCSPLKSIGGDFSIQETGVEGVSNSPAFIGGDVAIVDNGRLEGIDGLQGIRGTLLIQRNTDLSDLHSLVGLESIGGGLYLLNNPALADFCGLGPFMRGPRFNGTFAAVGNSVNPTIEEIKGLAPCP